MIAWLRKPYRWAKLFSVLLSLAFGFALLDAFVIPKAYAVVEADSSAITSSVNSPSSVIVSSAEPAVESAAEEIIPEEIAAESTEVSDLVTRTPVVTETSYQDENIKITVERVEKYSTIFYVADIQLSDSGYLKTALANDTFGRNIKATTSEMAAAHQAILAINGDYYGFRDTGYVLRNGELYRDTGSGDALIIDQDGNFSVEEQSTLPADVVSNAWQIFSFGPALVEDSVVVVDASSEVSRSKSSNPRTAIGQISTGHYVVIVSDGRTDESEGLSLLQLATEFAERNAEVAYNLDGGGSSTMVFNGVLVNNPTSGKSNNERGVSDIVYFGYE